MRSRLALITLLALLAVSTFVVEKEIAYRSPSGASPFNPGPEGTSSLVEAMTRLGYEVVVVTSWSGELVRLSPCLIVLVSPELPYARGELKVLGELVSLGAGLVVADEGEHSNDVLGSLGVPVRISGDIVLPSGSPVFQAETSLGGRELRVLFAYASSLQLLPARNGSTKVVAKLGDRVLGVIYESKQLKVAVLGDGSVLTNALISPANPLNPNYVFARELLRALCPSGGTVLVEGSKYRHRATGPGFAAILDPLSKALGLALLASVSTYLALQRGGQRATAEKGPRDAKGLYAYGAARRLCSDDVLARLLGCDSPRTWKPEEVLRRAIEASRGSREVAARILRVLSSHPSSASRVEAGS